MTTVALQIMIFLAGVVAYLYIGRLATRWYNDKIEDLEKELSRQWGEEFSMWRTGLWTTLMFFFWPFVWPYEYFTNFRQWKPPYYRISDQY